MNTQLFIEKAKQKHGNKYDYSKSEIINFKTKIIITCNEGHEFQQNYSKHLKGQGCKKCVFVNNSNKYRYSTGEFIQKAKEIHGDKFDYSKVEYIKNTHRVIIKCNKCNKEYNQRPIDHLSGAGGCNNCFQLKRGDSTRLTNEEFIKKAKEIHGDIYEYLNINYINSKTSIIIYCKKHGDFLQTPNNHISGHGCKKCCVEKNGFIQRYTNEEFIEKAKEIHGNIFDYSKAEYITSTTDIIIICKNNHEFIQKPVHHLQGYGCIKCNDRIYNNNDFIEKAKKIHKNIYDYSKVEYVNCISKIIIICNKHGEFLQSPSDHVNAESGCQKCKSEFIGNLHRYSKNKFIDKAIEKHGNIFDYSKVDYINSGTGVIIICKNNHEYIQKPVRHLAGQGCPICVNKTESKLYERMNIFYPQITTQFKQDWCKKIKHLPFDFCILEYKIIIELDGRQHFHQVWNWASPEVQFENDKYKQQCANENGFSVIRLLQEDVLYDTYDWVKELSDAIEELKSTKQTTNIYLSKNNEYNNYYIKVDTESFSKPK